MSKESRRFEIRIAGLGGQGVVLAGHILGKAAAYDGLQVVQTQSYGAEARGSAARSEVIISDQKIAFPMVRRNDVFVAMSQTALERHLKDLKDDGILVFDGDMVKESPVVKAQVFNVPATRTAETQLKSKMQTNMVMLGALTKITKIVTPGSVEKALRETLGAEGATKSIEAFKTGFDLI